MNRIIFVLLSSISLLVMGLAPAAQPNSPTQLNAVIDFEGLAEGTIVSSLSSGAGISGDDVGGFVGVFAENTNFPGENAAMIFDATCPPGGVPADCSGGDSDLLIPELGNILIISEDLDSTDPDDADLPDAYYSFDFSTWGTGVVTIHSIDVADVEDEEDPGAENIFLYSGGPDTDPIAVIDITSVGDNQYEPFTIEISNVDYMLIDLNGSGALDNIELTVEEEENAVELLDFRVHSVTPDKVTLVWETAMEVDNYGFNLYRSPDANFANAELVHFEPATGAAHQYVYADPVPYQGAWWYWLADIDTEAGETYHGPVSTIGMATMSNFLFVPILVSE